MTFITNNDYKDFGSSGNLGYSVGSYVEFDNTEGFNSIGFSLIVPSGATLQFKGSFDGNNYSNMTLRSISSDGYANKVTSTSNYIGSISTVKKFRTYVIASGGTYGTVYGRASKAVNTLEGIEHGPPEDFAISIVRGRIYGASIDYKFGNNPDIDTGTVPEDVWSSGGVYPGFNPTVSQKLTIYSASSSDTYNGVGARTLEIIGLNGDFGIQTETVTLSGLMPVKTSKSFIRVNRAYVVTAGSSKSSVGAISIVNQSGTALAYILGNNGNQTQQCVYTVPSGYTGYIQKLYGSMRKGSASTTSSLELQTREPGSVFRTRRPVGLSNSSFVEMDIYGGLPVPEMTDIKVTITYVSANGSDITSGFTILLFEN